MHGVTLTPTAPRQDLPVSPPAGSATLVLTLVAIDNPSSQAFSLAASLAATGGGQRDEPIGSVTPFPSTQPGSFVLTLPEPARKSAVRDGQLVLRLTLQPIAADRPLAEPLRVTVGAPAWR